ncbi:MAG: DUF3899 domain-containing protein [Treponema sp.]|nr:DUF3899 domain-containing protein [Treponema sp.]
MFDFPQFIKKNLHIIIAVFIGLFIALTVIFYEKSLFDENQMIGKFSIARLLCDGFFVSSVFLLSVGGMSAVLEHGGFDAIRYATARLVDRIKHPNPKDRDYESYYDYVKEKHSKKTIKFLYLLVIGAIFLAISIVLVFFA